MVLTTKLYTAEDLWAMPGDEPWEIWDGELRKVPSAGGRASRVASRISSRIDQYLERHNLGIVTGADGSYVLRSPGTVVVPDVAFVRWDRLPDGDVPVKCIPIPPDLAVEVQSPSDEPKEMAHKRRLYADAGVPLLWWVNPETRTVAIYRSGELAEVLSEGDLLDGSDVLPGLSIAVSDVFPLSRPR